jgi:cellulose synthase operon protein YhjQ
MDMHLTAPTEEPLVETPEDVAILYSWANLHGAKYRDFSASRREYRAQVRHRAAEELRRAELQAQAQAETAATEAERLAREAERLARASERFDSPLERESALRAAEVAGRRAAAERVEAARRAEAAAIADATARREEREIALAHASAERQAAHWDDSEIRRQALAGPQPMRVTDPYEVAQGSTVDGDIPTPNEALEYTQPERYRSEPLHRAFIHPDARPIFRQPEPEVVRRQGFRLDRPSGPQPAFRSISASSNGEESGRDFSPPSPQRSEAVATPFPVAGVVPVEPSVPAWLFAGNPSVAPAPRPQPAAGLSGLRSTVAPSLVTDTFQGARELVASRWNAVEGVFDPSVEPFLEPRRQKETLTPYLAVFSLAGGVGKTSLVATLGRALASLGEEVMVADTTSHGLLPYYFGATELDSGLVRTFSPPSGSNDAPIHLVGYDVERCFSDKIAQQVLANEIADAAADVQRLLVDCNAGSGWLMRGFTRMSPTVLVPLAPDMNSVIGLQAIERYFQGAVDGEDRPVQPYYLLNQFDPSLPLHLDVREVLRRRLGERLLPYVIHRSAAVGEALAEGMTVVDYQPEGAIADDFLKVAKWLHEVSAPANRGLRTMGWSER